MGFILFFSCNKKHEKTKVKIDIIDRKKLVNVLVDCYLVEGAIILKQQDGTNIKEYTKYYYDFIFKKHQITRDQLFESIKYYCYRINDLSKIYTEVQNNLTSIQQPLNTSEE